MLRLPVLLLLAACLAHAVDRSAFKTCEQSGFCRRNRKLQPGPSHYFVKLASVQTPSPGKLTARMINAQAGVEFDLELIALVDNTLRMRVLEHKPVRPRFEAKEALVAEPVESRLEITETTSEALTFTFGANKAVLSANPFRLDVYSQDQLVLSANSRGLFNFEHYRSKESAVPKPQESEDQAAQEGPDEEGPRPPAPPPEEDDGLWEESFKGKTDTKPYGPASVGLDFSFIGFQHLYGIPEHADQFVLKQTKGVGDPYRLFNLDVAEYELNNPMALYGSVPYVIAQSETRTIGLLWLNAAETWVDLESPSKQGVVSSIVDFVKGTTPSSPQQDTHWFSETGILDVFFFLGPRPKDVARQYGRLTGTTPLPPLFSLGYHQCRWNYKDQEDVRNVDAKFDENDMPYDVIWLDLDHTDNRKYFTWDPYFFPTPEIMINNLTAKGRKMVTLVDPHIKRDSGYFIHQEASAQGFYVKNKDGGDYEGWCWPGSSGYLDFFNPAVRAWWAQRFRLENYPGSTLSLYTWNDMNEPSVFSDPEITMLRDNRHFGDWEHRDVHNMYGMMMVSGTYEGHLIRSDYQQRPFILSRAFFAGTQRYAAVWTGDNTADWGHLRISVPMILTLGVTGLTFSGADVGGFFNNPPAELVVRWYQAGAFQPFFRAHAHHDTKRREPYLFEGDDRNIIRAALKKRYSFLPFWYTLFFENERTGLPPMRPLWMEFPTDPKTFPIDDSYIIGSSLLVRPVLESGVSSVNVYFPGNDDVWYDIDNYQRHEGGRTESIHVDLSKIPVYQRGGSIIAKKERIRRSSSLSHHDPFTLYIALDKSGSTAQGQLFIDSYDGFGYRKGDYLLLNYTYSQPVLKARIQEGPGKFKTREWLERIVVIGLTSEPKSIELKDNSGGSINLHASFSPPTLVIRKPGVNMGQEWDIVFTF